MANFLREHSQGTYYDISVTTYQKWRGKVRSAEFDGLESIYVNLNFMRFSSYYWFLISFSLRNFICLEEHTVCS